MNARDIILVNQLLEVLNPEQNIYYKSIVQEITDEYIVIGMPLRRRRQLYLDENRFWGFRLTRKDSLYYFRSKLLGQRRERGLQLFLVAWPDKLKRVQRRLYFRLPCTFDAHYWVLTEGCGAPLEKAAEQMGEPERAIIADISGGGLQLIMPEQLPIGTVLLMILYLESKRTKKSIYVIGKVLRVWPYRREQEIRFRHGLEFIDLTGEQRETIVKYIFLLMRERLS